MDVEVTSPDGVTHNQIDYTMLNKKCRSNVTNCKAFPSADVGSDQQLVLANIRLKLKNREYAVNKSIFEVKKLKEPEIAAAYRERYRENAEGLAHCADKACRDDVD